MRKYQQLYCESLLLLTKKTTKNQKENLDQRGVHIHSHCLPRGGFGKRALKRSRPHPPDVNWKMMLSTAPGSGPKRLSRAVHISNIASKLLTGRGLINARVERFLLHLPFFLTEMMNSAVSDLAGKRSSRRSLPLSSFKEVKLLIPPFRNEKGESAQRGVRGAYFPLNLIYILEIYEGIWYWLTKKQLELHIWLPCCRRKLQLASRPALNDGEGGD